MIAGIVSIGTNSTRALVAELTEPPHVLLSRSTGTRVGEGLKELGRLEDDAMDRTIDAVREHVRAIRERTGNIRAIATSALRRAQNGEEFAGRVSAIAGVPLQIISGEDEARRSFAGAVAGLKNGDGSSIGVLDVGGGSSDYAGGYQRGPDGIASCEIGAVRLTEAFPGLAGRHGAVDSATEQQARELVREKLQPLLTFRRPDRAIFAGGSATTAVNVVRGARRTFTYAPLTREDVGALIARLLRCDLETRRTFAGMNPQRADIFPAGLVILDEFFALTAHTAALVSTNDLLLGTLLLEEKQ